MMPNGSKWLTRLREKTGPAEYFNQIMTEWAYEFEERASILEYDGSLSLNEAEQQALIEVNSRLKAQEVKQDE